MSRMQKWLLGVAAFLVLVLIAVQFLNWNLLKPYIERRVSNATGRTFAINGDLDVKLSLHPRVIVNEMVLGNAEWARDKNMAEIGQADFRISLFPLLAGRLSFPSMALSRAAINLEVSKDGTPNWKFKEQDKANPTELPPIGSLAIDQGVAKYLNSAIKTDVSIKFATREPTAGEPESMVDVSGTGTFKGQRSSINGTGGALLSLRNAERPYPIKAHAVIGTTTASIDGVLIDPLNLKGEQLKFTLAGSDMAQLFPLIGVPLPPTPAYKLAGKLDHTGDVWTFSRFTGTVGHSDLAGDFSVDRGKSPQFIRADLISKNLDMADLGGFVGADRGDKPASAPPPADKLLPVETFNLEKLRSANADVKFKGAHIVTKKLPLEKMETHLLIKDGNVKLAPLNFSVAGGNLVTQIEMDARRQRIATRADITAKGLHLDQLIPNAKMSAVSAGTMGGRATLSMGGNSLSQMFGSANGDAALIMDGGTISELLLRASNLDIANGLARLLGGDRQTPINCLVGTFKAVEGDFKVQTLVLDTSKVSVHGTGNVMFPAEAVNVHLVAKSKGFSLASLRGPINIGGTLKNPTFRPELGGVLARGGLAVAIGLATAGIGTLIPLLEFGNEKPTNCAALVQEAKTASGTKASDIAPRPAKTKR